MAGNFERHEDHLQYLLSLDKLDLANLYSRIEADESDWPDVDGVPLGPIALTLFCFASLIKKLAPDEDVVAMHAEARVIPHALGHLTEQLSSIATVLELASTPSSMEAGRFVDSSVIGMQMLAEDIFDILGIKHGEGSAEETQAT